MLDSLLLTGSWPALLPLVLEQVDRLTRQRLIQTEVTGDGLRPILSTARFSPALPVFISGSMLPDGSFLPDTELSECAEYAANARTLIETAAFSLPNGYHFEVALEIDRQRLAFVASLVALDQSQTASALPGKEKIRPIATSAPIGQEPANVARWFTALVEAEVPKHDGQLKTSQAAVGAFVQLGKAANTRRAYRSAVRGWCAWVARHDLPALPARSEDVATYLADLALRGRKPATIELHRAALRYLHHISHLPIPTTHALVSETLAGIHRSPTKTPPRQVKGLTWEMVCEVVDTIPMTSLVGARDRAILLLGYGGALRRSELAAIQLEHVTLDEDCMRITLPHSKGDKKHQGTTIVIPRGITRHCPVRAWETWLRQSKLTPRNKSKATKPDNEIETTAAFPRIWLPAASKNNESHPTPKIGTQSLSDFSVVTIIKKRCQAAGIEGDFSGHSLRRGAITTGAQDGLDLITLKRFSRHRDYRVLEAYIEEGEAFTKHPGKTRF
ncbi:tyrosine-type recombinase/integrase [Acetobacter cerevisiae]|uniref:tyrosine-type recombinase/integrase n=1 Tax=Acetobacter cerevisiae TaxID=178900 RepID=UPI0020A0F178|nr:tyrosine-type recombinase/integrase [Acetobacter cerevisiae]MCP1271641.1 tyrosine-type recombinase/integrase [Acetobacter cerevisiae]MCP1279595.1 tyrosine-type recombinase/integrase [Acetobacter cerevisiae]